MGFRSTPCLFLGYSPFHHGYRCLDLSSNRLYIARHICFDESTFLLTTTPNSPDTSPSPIQPPTSPPPVAPTTPTPQPNPILTSPSPVHCPRPSNLHNNPKQCVPFQPTTHHTTTSVTEPTSFTIANKSPKWCKAMEEEYCLA